MRSAEGKKQGMKIAMTVLEKGCCANAECGNRVRRQASVMVWPCVKTAGAHP